MTDEYIEVIDSIEIIIRKEEYINWNTAAQKNNNYVYNTIYKIEDGACFWLKNIQQVSKCLFNSWQNKGANTSLKDIRSEVRVNQSSCLELVGILGCVPALVYLRSIVLKEKRSVHQMSYSFTTVHTSYSNTNAKYTV